MCIFEKMIGKDVVVRANGAGVLYGKLTDCSPHECILANARHIYSWNGALTVCSVASKGVSSAKISEKVKQVYVTNLLEVCEMNEEAMDSLRKHEK